LPANPRTLQATEAYRRRVIGTRKALQGRAERLWPTIQQLDDTAWSAQMAAAVAQSQTEAVRITSGYLGAVLTLETGKRTAPPPIDPSRYAGLTRDGRTLSEAFQSPLIGVLGKLKEVYADKAKRVDVTPEMAQKWLAGGTHGNLDAEVVDQIAAKIKAGDWNPELGNIMVSANGFVWDGQHRLEAIIKAGETVPAELVSGFINPLEFGLNRATRMVGVEYDWSHHQSMMDAIAEDDRFDGWQRSLAGTCGACASVAGGVSHAVQFEVHPGCQCVAIAVVVGVVAKIAVPTGQEVFNAKTVEQQDEMLGPEPAALVRDGVITLSDLYERSPLEEGDDFITQKPLKRLINKTQEV
jgi:hypothetical protein